MIHSNGRITDKFFIKSSEGYRLIDAESQLTPSELNKRSLLLMFQEHWDAVFEEAKICSITKGQRITNAALEAFYSQVISDIPNYCYQVYSLVHAYTLLNEFIAYQNNNFQTQTTAYPMPPKAVKAKINTLSIDFDWIKNGKQVSNILNIVHRHWRDTDRYTEAQIIGWLIFSAIVYGGVNDRKTLVSYINIIIELKERQPFINFNIINHVRYKNKQYGNEYTSNNLYCTQQIVTDSVTMCWLIRLNDYHSKAELTPSTDEKIPKILTETNIDKILKTTLSPLLIKQSIKMPTLAFMLSNSSYIWEMLRDINVDQALVTILKGRQNTVGLTNEAFERLLDQRYETTQKTYDNSDFLDLEITASNDETESRSSRRQADDELDLIKALKQRLNKNYKHQNKSKTQSNIADELLQMSNERPLNYKILIRWVLSLVEKEGISNESISKYITAMGYEWLSFTKDQPLETWTTEYFEELYDEILDDIAVTDLSYPAKQLQNMHRFAEVEYGFPKVKVPLTSSQRKVRSEWFSPQLFASLLEQLKISIDVVEADMLSVLFIVAYRTGMRKKEILGLKYADIEGMKQGKPSVMIRPNHYRLIKTDNSIREIPLFALLKPSELALFIKFISINETRNDQRFIFTLSSSHLPLADHVPIKLLNLLHQDIGGSDDVRMMFHGFRHTAMTNLALVMQGHPDLVMSMTDYDQDDIERIKRGLLGEHICGQELWYSCAHLFGHLSPDRGFEHYNHTAWLMASYSLSQAKIQLPYAIFKNITGIDKKQLKENGYLGDIDNIDLQKIRKLLYRQVLNKDYRSPKQFPIQEEHNHVMVADAQDKSNQMLLKRYGLRRVIGFLEDMADDENIDNIAAKFDIDNLHAQQYFDNAMQVRNILTNRGHKRFFTETDTIKLAPSLLKNSREQRILSHFFTSATTVRDQKNEQWNQFVTVATSKMSTSRPSINFSTKDVNKVIDFLKIGTELIEDKYWLIRGSEEIISLLKKELSDYPGLKFETYNPENVISLGIHNPNSKKDAKNDKNNSKIKTSSYEYSPLFRFAIHLTLILDLEAQF